MNYLLKHGDSLEVMKGLKSETIDAIVTDPPYGLGFMGKEWDTPGALVERKADRAQSWDHVGGNHNPTCAADAARTRQVEGRRFQAFSEAWAREAFRVLKPGGHLLAFGGTRTYHRLACAIEDVGFEVRDSLHWFYGQGFPKSLDVSKAIDKANGAVRPVIGKHPAPAGTARVQTMGRPATAGSGWQAAPDLTAPATPEAARWDGWGTALKPAHEPIILARKPLAGTVAGNVLKYGTGALNVEACRVETTNLDDYGRSAARADGSMNPGLRGYGEAARAGHQQATNPAGRWPPNVLLTHAPECDGECAPGCPVAELDRQSGDLATCGGPKNTTHDSEMFGIGQPGHVYQDSGGASRFFPVFEWSEGDFFYCAKASRRERGEANKHPTVKPVKLMRWLCKLVTPPNGIILDPFLGSGTTAIAALAEGFKIIGIEKETDYIVIAESRIAKALGGTE